MRTLIVSFLVTLGLAFSGCAHGTTAENNQQNQDSRHSVCIEADIFTDIVQQQMDQNGAGGRVFMNYCGPLADPHKELGISMIETVIPLANKAVQHSFLILKFAKTPEGWRLIAEPEVVVSFVQNVELDTTQAKQKTLSL